MRTTQLKEKIERLTKCYYCPGYATKKLKGVLNGEAMYIPVCDECYEEKKKKWNK